MKLSWKEKAHLDIKDVLKIRELEEICLVNEDIVFKFELDYKLKEAQIYTKPSNILNEFFCYNYDELIGYFGISQFTESIMEVSGVVKPNYRNRGIGKKLISKILEEARNRVKTILLLTDNKSIQGKNFIEKLGGKKVFSEYELTLNLNNLNVSNNNSSLELIKAKDTDAIEIMKQNSLMEGKEFDPNLNPVFFPSKEEKKGIIEFLAILNDIVIGKIRLVKTIDIGWIYGFFIYPEFRGKGYGKTILQKALSILKQDNHSEAKLQVDTDNQIAFNLYTNTGFKIDTTIDYYEVKVI